ncbi:MAG: HAMP domain-containing sensor histidine kinase, partial [Elusimicrobiota bacterium]
ENLHTLIQNLLDISKMEDNKLPLRQEKVKLFDLLYDTGKQFGLAAKTESKEFTFSIQDEIPVVKIDAMLIKRVVTNLLTNSLHHTTSGGKIWLSVANNEESRTVRVEIGDDGVGIPEEYRTRIFEKFVQVERRRARLRTGTGLGLTFCKMAVELHGGKIWVESEEGRGSKFFFEIPLN